MTRYFTLPRLVMTICRVMAFITALLILTPICAVYRLIYPRNACHLSLFFHRCMLALFHIKLRVTGAPTPHAPTLFVANHSSYLDVPALGAILPAAFVAKAEVARWPLFGFLARAQNTIFIERRAAQAAQQRQQLRDHLARGQNLILFPEGTSSNGLITLPFKSSLFAIMDAQTAGVAVTVQPISVTCTHLNGAILTPDKRDAYAWHGDMTLVPHLWQVFKNDAFIVEVIFHPPIAQSDYPDRKMLALACHAKVAGGVAQSLTRHGEKECGATGGDGV